MLYMMDMLCVLSTYLLILITLHLITAELRDIRDIASELNSDDKDKEENDDDEEAAAKIPPTHTANLEACVNFFTFRLTGKDSFFEKSRKQKEFWTVRYFCEKLIGEKQNLGR